MKYSHNIELEARRLVSSSSCSVEYLFPYENPLCLPPYLLNKNKKNMSYLSSINVVRMKAMCTILKH